MAFAADEFVCACFHCFECGDLFSEVIGVTVNAIEQRRSAGIQWVMEAGPEGISATDLKDRLVATYGGTPRSCEEIMRHAYTKGTIFGRLGCVAGSYRWLRYFGTAQWRDEAVQLYQSNEEAVRINRATNANRYKEKRKLHPELYKPKIDKRTVEAAARRVLREQEKVARALIAKVPKPPKPPKPLKPPKAETPRLDYTAKSKMKPIINNKVLRGEPIYPENVKRTVHAGYRGDPRFMVEPGFVGEFTREWMQRRQSA